MCGTGIVYAAVMCGTSIAYAVICRPRSLAIALRAEGTGIAYAAVDLRACYAMSGTRIAYAVAPYDDTFAKRCRCHNGQLSPVYVGQVLLYLPTRVLCDVQYCHSVCLRARYAISGTDIAYGAGTSKRERPKNITFSTASCTLFLGIGVKLLNTLVLTLLRAHHTRKGGRKLLVFDRMMHIVSKIRLFSSALACIYRLLMLLSVDLLGDDRYWHRLWHSLRSHYAMSGTDLGYGTPRSVICPRDDIDIPVGCPMLLQTLSLCS
eukprot:436521-Rhodomonas_salina.3